MNKFTVRAATVLAIPALLMSAACQRSSSPEAVSGSGDGAGTEFAANGNLFMSVMPPGSNGNSAGGVGAPLEQIPTIQYPQNFRDQLDMYGNLSYAKPGLKGETCNPPKNIGEHVKSSDQACNYFKPAGITLAAGEAVSTRTMTAPNGKSVTIQRDAWGVPYISGENRSAAQYGLGFAAAQDRLWLFDVLRRAGRGRASEFLGPSDTTYGLDLQFGPPAGYSEIELTDMVNRTVSKLGELGPMFLNDTQMFVAGMNAFIAYLQTPEGLAELPPEYATLALAVPPNFPPKPFTVNDIVANAVLIQSALGGGGGGEATNLNLLQKLDGSIGPNTSSLPRVACETWRDLRHANLTDTPHTIDRKFATQSPSTLNENCPASLSPAVALWDKDSFSTVAFLRHANAVGVPLLNLGALPSPLDALSRLSLSPFTPVTGSGGGLVDARPPLKNRPVGKTLYASDDPLGSLHRTLNKYGLPMTTSNWIGVNGSETKSGHPIAVMGPQTGYFNPQLLWEAAVVSKGNTPYELAARGISTVNLPYIVIGHGIDFAWSPTSAGSDFTDTRVSKMCNLDGSTPSRGDANDDGFPDADGYLYKGQCVKFYKRTDEWTATPTAASIALGGAPTPEAVKRFVIRTHYGPVFATATVNGEPVAVSTQRSTFLSDVDTAAPFALLTTTGTPMTAKRFKQLFNTMTSTFNWLYLDKKDLSYIQSGLYPKRASGHNPELPVWGDGRFEWVADQDFDPTVYGGDKPFPSRTKPVAQGKALDGYFEWPGYLSLAEHIQDTNPSKGYMANWNNSGAPGWWAADGNGTYGPTHRVAMLQQRLAGFKASGRKHDIGSMIEVMGDAAYTDLRGFDVLPLIIQVMKSGPLTDEQSQVIALLQGWMDEGSANWINNSKGLGSYRRDRDPNGTQYGHRAAVVLMDAWYPHLIDTVTPQMVAIEAKGASLLSSRQDAPRAQGSAYQEGWFQHMRRMFQMALNTPGHSSYRQLKCAGTGVLADCRKAVNDALALALTDLGGLSNQAKWDGSSIANAKGRSGAKVEDYDAVEHTSFSFIPVPAIPWINRPTFQQAVQVSTDRDGNH